MPLAGQKSKIELTPELVYGFSELFLQHRFDSLKETPLFHHELWELFCDSWTHVAAAAPRGHAKSTAITHTLSMALLCFKIRDHGLIVSDTEGQAIQFLQDIRREFDENEKIIDHFGKVEWIKEAEKEIIGIWPDGDQFRMLALGSGQKPRGMKWRHRRPNFIIGDDLENDERVENEDRRVKFRNWIFNALLPAGSDYCIYRIVGTILHLDSFLNRLMPDPQDDLTVSTPLKVYSKDKSRPWKSVLWRAHPAPEDFSEILWEEMFSKDKLEAIRKRFIEQGFPEGYAQEYLNNPLDESLAYFKKEQFKDISDANRIPNQKGTSEPEEFYAAADLAISTKDSRAYSVIVVCGLTPEGILRVRDIRRFRGDSYDIVEEMFAVQQQYKPRLFALEKENIASAIGPILEDEMRKGRDYINLEEMLPHGQDKIRRARPIQFRMRAGTIEYDMSQPWYPALEHEMIYFPRGKYSDQVDALAWIGQILDRMELVDGWEERENQEWHEEFFTTMTYGDLGRDSLTGY